MVLPYGAFNESIAYNPTYHPSRTYKASTSACTKIHNVETKYILEDISIHGAEKHRRNCNPPTPQSTIHNGCHLWGLYRLEDSPSTDYARSEGLHPTVHSPQGTSSVGAIAWKALIGNLVQPPHRLRLFKGTTPHSPQSTKDVICGGYIVKSSRNMLKATSSRAPADYACSGGHYPTVHSSQ